MNSWAIIKTGGKQYKVAAGQPIIVDKITKDAQSSIVFDQVLLVKNEENLKIGRPMVENVKVKGKILENFKDKKIRVVKFKSKSRYLRTTGHRQPKTKVLIEKIES